MIKTKVERVSGGVAQDLEAKGSTHDILIELKALNIGVLGSLSLSVNGEEMTLDERIKLFCKIMNIEEGRGR